MQNAGEVYGEKAILATEVRELQSRLVSMSDERNKALAMLDEVMSSALTPHVGVQGGVGEGVTWQLALFV